jgi:hypothetical protein
MLKKYFPSFIDATEQEIPRPKDKGRRKSNYSGKKKRHTVKTQLTVNKEGLIIHIINHVRGRRHGLTWSVFLQILATMVLNKRT